MPHFRHEIKHEITYSDMLSIKSRMDLIAGRDKNAKDGTYFIRSLYFDNLYDKALNEKIDGVNMREKFRIRFYNFDTSYIMLEKKSKINGLCEKRQARLSKEEAQAIVSGNLEWMKETDRDLLKELYVKMKYQGLRPKTIVDYDREPFVYAPGNVRVTLDYNIRTGLDSTDFLNPKCITLPPGDEHIVLEVKWDEYLPEIIKAAVATPTTHSTSFSKYATCRIYG